MALRKRVLDREPLCRSCFESGRITEATEADHIIPLHAGGTNDEENMQGLCSDCHAIKTGTEIERYRRGFSKKIGEDGFPEDDWHPSIAKTAPQKFSIPHFLRKSAIPVRIVTGPPASGKSSYIEKNAQPDDLVIDFDLIRQNIGASRYDNNPDILKRTFKIRDAMLRSLCQRTKGQAWLAVMAPSNAERTAWVKALGNATVIAMEAAPDECKRRIMQDPKREGARPQLCLAVDRWFKERTRGGNIIPVAGQAEDDRGRKSSAFAD